MSEPKKQSVILQEQIDALKKELETLKKPKPETSTPESEHVAMPDSAKGHKTIDEVADCPNCKPKLLEKLRPELFKEFKEKLKSHELVTCDGCGEIVGKEEKECPGCHGTRAH